jgi:ABC-type nitrate/sulfonate/bicarbonate transport system ATPase subunit
MESIAKPALVLENVSHRFERPEEKVVDVLENISFSIERGQFVSCVGPSGCGKSTLAQIIAGYIQPDTGTVFVEGHAVSAPGKNQILINQENDLFNWMTIQNNLDLVSNNAALIENYLTWSGLDTFAHAYPAQLSGGMKKRASLIRAIVSGTPFIIMDEPFASLDYFTRERIHNMVRALVAETGTTVFLVTHDIEEAVYLSDTVIVLSSRPARIVDSHSTSQFRSGDMAVKDEPGFIEIKKLIRSQLFS